MQTNTAEIVDCAIIGGGLAGLCLSIQLAKKGHKVVVLEKNTYPFHKVCGEYISMESWDFLIDLGLPLTGLKLPIIDRLNVSAHNGYKISSPLDMGGFGISRFTLDYELVKIARENGVTVLENSKVTAVELINGVYKLNSTTGPLSATVVCGSYGKVNPAFMDKPNSASTKGFIAVKYHIKTAFPENLIELHNFKDGYCGISKVDNETYCLCYLTTNKNLRDNNNDIKLLEKNVLMRNPHLSRYFSESEFIFPKPLTISQITFSKKFTWHKNILMLGDAAGAIAPLCGNGMSLAMRSSKILSHYISLYLLGKISQPELIRLYSREWDQTFLFRIRTGFYLQKLFGKNTLTLWSLKFLNASPRLFRKIISLTHGEKFNA